MPKITRPNALVGFTLEDESAAQNSVCQATLARARKGGRIRYAIWAGRVWVNDADVDAMIRSRIKRRNPPRPARRKTTAADSEVTTTA
jgi:hypothetical protein